MSDAPPVIDIADLDRTATLDEIDAACRQWGFFQIVGHGLAANTVETLRRQMHAFFALPLTAKREIMRTAENPWGFYDRELTQHRRDWKQVYDYGPPDGDAIRPQWPVMRVFAPAIRGYYAACDALAKRLLAAISINLGMPPDHLDSSFQPAHTSFLRLNYYPKCPQAARSVDASVPAAGHLGVNPHTDAGAVTLLLQDGQPGLEVLHDGRWCLIEPRNDALVVNIGDIAQVWSNDRYHAALHRGLANVDAERFSAAFFLNPAYSSSYAPLNSTIDGQHPPRYRSINWGEFRARRTAGDYADHGEYARIDQYRH